MELTFIQIQCVPISGSIACSVYMYGLASDGTVWFKRDCDNEWTLEPMKFRVDTAH